MKRALVSVIVLVAAVFAGESPASTQAEVIDRIVVVVNRTPILASDCDEELRFEAFVDGHAPATTEQAREAALERLIDQKLIEQQMVASNYVPARDGELETAMQQVRRQISSGGRQWAEALRQYGLTDTVVTEHVRRQVNQLRYIELRFQSEARPAPAAVQRYYSEQYLLRLRAAGGADKPLAEVREQIERILTEQRIDQLLAAWLQTLRSQAQIERRAPVAAAKAGTGGESE